MGSIGTLEETELRNGTHESNALFNRAVELLNRNRAEAARKQLEAALQICPRHPGYLSLYGLCVAVESGDFESARRICETAVRLNPKDPVGHVNLGKVLRLQGDNGGAYGEFLAGWKVDKQHPAPAVELSRMGIRRPPVLPFFPRTHWLNVSLGKLRTRLLRMRAGA